MKNNLKFIAALAIPIVVLLGLAIYQQVLSVTGEDHVVAIEGYDPRDLLAGNYLRFRIKYNTSRDCSAPNNSLVYMCMKPNQQLLTSKPDSTCEQWIEGKCRNQAFEDDINRFYIPAENAKAIEKEVFDGHAQIRLSIGKGSYVIKDLLINGKSWQEMR